MTVTLIVVSQGVTAARSDEAVVTVAPLLLMEPSAEQSTEDLSSLGLIVTEPGQLTASDTVYLEIWFQTSGPHGISTAVLDITYETTVLDTTFEQITLCAGWVDVFDTIVDDPAGFIRDVGGISFVAQGLRHWAKLVTIEFDVVDTPTTEVSLCTPDGGFGMLGIGEIPDASIDYRCTCLEESTLTTLGPFVACLSGPGVTVLSGCACADVNQNTKVDLADFAGIQTGFGGP